MEEEEEKKDTTPRMYSTASVDGIDEILQVKIYRGLFVLVLLFIPNLSHPLSLVCFCVDTLVVASFRTFAHFFSLSYLFISCTVIRPVCHVDTCVFGTLVVFVA